MVAVISNPVPSPGPRVHHGLPPQGAKHKPILNLKPNPPGSFEWEKQVAKDG